MYSLTCLPTSLAALLAAGSPRTLTYSRTSRLDQDPHAWHDADADTAADADAAADDDDDADADAETPVEADAASTRQATSTSERGPPPGSLPVVPLLRSNL